MLNFSIFLSQTKLIEQLRNRYAALFSGVVYSIFVSFVLLVDFFVAVLSVDNPVDGTEVEKTEMKYTKANIYVFGKFIRFNYNFKRRNVQRNYVWMCKCVTTARCECMREGLRLGTWM